MVVKLKKFLLRIVSPSGSTWYEAEEWGADAIAACKRYAENNGKSLSNIFVIGELP